jgi:hypothetical protein
MTELSTVHRNGAGGRSSCECQGSRWGPQDATGLPRGAFTMVATDARLDATRCHRLAPWSVHDGCYRRSTRRHKMPRACPVGAFTMAATGARPARHKMPQDATGLPRRSVHDGCYRRSTRRHKMPRACPVGAFTMAATDARPSRHKMPRACPVGEFTMAATGARPPRHKMPRACPVGGSRS